MNTRSVRTAITVVFAALLAAACGSDPGSPSAGSSSAITTEVAANDAPASTAASTTPPDSTPVTSATTAPTTAPTTAAPVTTAAPTVSWVEADVMPSLAYLPCCASNYVGEPSPEVPVDGTAPLLPGIYRVVRDQPAAGETFDPETIMFSLAPFQPCGSPGVSCEEPFADGEVGVGPFARKVVMSLTDDVRVVVGGFRCLDDQTNWTTDHQRGTGTLLAALQADLEAAYSATVAPLVEAGTPFEDYATLFATPTGGFGVPCQFAGVLEWQGSTGPGLLLQTLGRYDDAAGRVVVPASISVEILHLTAYELADDGTETLYFYAGFLS